MKVKQFEDLRIWKDAVQIGVDVYNITRTGPLATDYSGRDQIRRAAISISNNIAEGFEYSNNRDFIRFLRYAKGSAGELRSNLVLFRDAKLLESEVCEALKVELVKLSRAIEKFIQYLKAYERNSKEINP